ncbi:MAG: hypothetical protein KAI97_04530, partial [Gemmatimonadetes bacterium]|nr:hypothetical protein [Gemmatimonadota bacterium]
MKNYRFEKKKSVKAVVLALLAGVVLLLATATIASAQEDNTGTNPVNFTYDFRLITEMQSFTEDAGSLLKHTLEFRAPLGRNIANLTGAEAGTLFRDLGNTFALRFRAYHQDLSLNDPTSSETTEVSGIGDFDARLLAIAYTSPKLILAPGLEAFFDTASNDALGSGKHSLGPVLFAVLPGILGGRSLFAPGYQYIFDIGGESDRTDISRSQIDLYFVWMLAANKNWLIVNPQIILDHENSAEFMTVDAEWGFMIAPKSGISGYVRPG